MELLGAVRQAGERGEVPHGKIRRVSEIFFFESSAQRVGFLCKSNSPGHCRAPRPRRAIVSDILSVSGIKWTYEKSFFYHELNIDPRQEIHIVLP